MKGRDQQFQREVPAEGFLAQFGGIEGDGLRLEQRAGVIHQPEFLQRLCLGLQRTRPDAQVHEQPDRRLHQRHGARVGRIAPLFGHQRHAPPVEREKAGCGEARGAGPGNDHIEFAHDAKLDSASPAFKPRLAAASAA